MKALRIMAVVLALAVALGLSGCGGSNINPAVQSESDSQQTPATDNNQQDNATDSAAIPPMNTYSYTITDGAGYKIEATIKIGSWIKGSDSQLLSQVWKAAGGTGEAPAVDSPSETAIVCGTISFANETPGYDITNDNPRTFAVKLTGTQGLSTTLLPSDATGPIGDDTTLSVQMNSNSWGPAPFAMVSGNVSSPNTPEGNPYLTEDGIFLGNVMSYDYSERDGVTFKIDKTW